MAASTVDRPSLTTDSAVKGTLVAAALAAIGVTVVAVLATTVGAASSEFQALRFPTYVVFAVVGVIAGAIGWRTIARRAKNPAGTMRWLVPTVLAVSMVPDLLVGATDALPGTSWGAVLSLMLMHLVVAAAALPAFRRFMPLPAAR